MAKSKKSKNKWFKSIRGSYLPISSKGWLTYLPFIAYLIVSFYLTWKLNAAVFARVYLVAVQWLLAGILMTLIAKQKS
jgi:hypothetical protein